MQTERDVATAAWGVAGVPLVVTLVQTVLALLDWTSATLGLRSLLDPLFDVAVVFEAAVVFKQQPALVLVLFLLIAVAWLVQGAAMLVTRNRDVAFAAAGFAALTYLVLFFGVYSALFSRGVGVLQLAAFFFVPLAASGLVVGAVFVHDWSADVVDRASGQLGDLETAVEAKREAFESAWATRIGDLDDVAAVAPSGVAEASEDRKSFHDTCDDLLDQVESLQSADEQPSRLRSEVSRLESRVDGLDPEETVDRIDRDLRRRVESGVRTELGWLGVESRFGEPYTLSNLPSEYRDVDLPGDEGAVHVDDVSSVIERRLEGGESLASVGGAVAAAAEHRERIESFLAERESSVADRIEAVEDRLATVDAQVERFTDPVAGRVRDVLVENRDGAVEGAAAVRRTVRDAKDALHDCQFDDADRLLDDAEDASRRLVTTAEFLGSLEGRVKHQGSTVSVPDGVDEAVVSSVAPALADHHGVDVSVVDDRVEIGDGDDTGTASEAAGGRGDAAVGDADGDLDDVPAEPPAGDDTAADAPDGDDGVSARPEDVLDSALYAFRELESHAGGADDGGRVQFQTDDLPPGVADRATLSHVERFLSRQSDLFETVTLQSPEPPAFLELVAVDGVRPEAALATARERFIERYD